MRVDHDETADETEVFAGQLTEDEASTAMVEVLLASENADRAEFRAKYPPTDGEEEEPPLTSHDIRQMFHFDVTSKKIRAT